MAMIDYGAIAWKDGKLISTGMFTDMIDMVGWDDSDTDVKTSDKLYRNYFAYVGDKDLTVAFYKDIMHIHFPEYEEYDRENIIIYFNHTEFKKWKYWRKGFIVDNDVVWIKVYPKRFHDYHICKIDYRGHKYKVAFGYGVDYDYYKKCHIIDYYGTPWCIIKDKIRRMHDLIRWKYIYFQNRRNKK